MEKWESTTLSLPNSMHTYISGELDRVEHGMAVIKLSDGQELKVPKEGLQPIPEKGTPMSIRVLPTNEAEQEQATFAKSLLNQILGNDS